MIRGTHHNGLGTYALPNFGIPISFPKKIHCRNTTHESIRESIIELEESLQAFWSDLQQLNTTEETQDEVYEDFRQKSSRFNIFLHGLSQKIGERIAYLSPYLGETVETLNTINQEKTDLQGKKETLYLVINSITERIFAKILEEHLSIFWEISTVNDALSNQSLRNDDLVYQLNHLNFLLENHKESEIQNITENLPKDWKSLFQEHSNPRIEARDILKRSVQQLKTNGFFEIETLVNTCENTHNAFWYNLETHSYTPPDNQVNIDGLVRLYLNPIESLPIYKQEEISCNSSWKVLSIPAYDNRSYELSKD
ncbi:MAG: hypothetical protein CMO81_06250 [Waddliaceae bacterium]|nr:hypothetical protein [Waddliaceae bacterium]